jgi:hypothetical protein
MTERKLLKDRLNRANEYLGYCWSELSYVARELEKSENKVYSENCKQLVSITENLGRAIENLKNAI